MCAMDDAVAAKGPVTTMSVPTFQAVDTPDPSGEPTKPAALRLSAPRVFQAIKDQVRFLSPVAQFLFFASCVLLVLTLPALVAMGMFGAPAGLDETGPALGGGLVLLGTMTVLFLLGRRSDRKRASDSFGRQVDRRPRM